MVIEASNRDPTVMAMVSVGFENRQPIHGGATVALARPRRGARRAGVQGTRLTLQPEG